MLTLRARSSLLAILLAAAPAAQREAVSTRPKLDFTPFTGTRKHRVELNPILAGDLVLATTTLRLFAFDARTAELRWSAGPPQGWEALENAARNALFSGVDVQHPWVAPAAGERVAVAALQLALSRHAAEEWQGIQTAAPIPERRLFAFELGTGRGLWNHAPPPGWDGKSGSFAQRMSLCASPSIVGGRILVPCVFDESSVDYHVACYELATGALLWSTFVLRGQIERNMFGKAVREFASAPLVAVPGRRIVLAQTGLGLIAALDLATGAILWRSEYQPIPLPKARSYTPPKRDVVWRMTPPIVAGEAVLATPPDSPELLALDLKDGHVLWTVANSALSTLEPASGERDIDHLVGAEGNVMYFGGIRPAAFVKPDGTRSATLEKLWQAIDLQGTIGRGHLSKDGICVPSQAGYLVLDRETGHSNRIHALARSTVALLVTDEALYVLTEDGLSRIER